MSVARDAVSQSHASGSASTNQSSFSWTHTPSGTPRGILVYVFSISATAQDTSVTYGGTTMQLVSGGEANDTVTEPGTVRTYFLGSSIPTGAQSVVVNRVNNATQMWAACYSATAANNTQIVSVAIQEENGTFAARSVDDGSPGNNSQRFAAGYSGGNNILAAATGSTVDASNDLGSYTCTTCYETTPGQGARNVGFTYATSDDRAYVVLAMREYQALTEVIVTFVADDGRETQYSESAPNLRTPLVDHGVHMTFYINSNWVGQHPAPGQTFNCMDWTEIGVLAGDGNDIANHTADHYVYTVGQEVTWETEIDECQSDIIAQSLLTPTSFSYPNGAWNDTAAGIVDAAGLLMSHTGDADLLAPPTGAETMPPTGAGTDGWQTVRMCRNAIPSSSTLASDVAWCQIRSGRHWLIYITHEGYSPIYVDLDNCLTWCANNSIAVKSVREVLIDEGVLVEGSDATGAISMKKMGIAGTGAAESAASGGPSMKKMAVAGTGSGESAATSAISMKKMSIAGEGSAGEVSDATGAISMKKMQIAGSGSGESAVTGAINMKKMGIAGTGAGESSVSGAISMKKMSLGGMGAGESAATGAISMKKMSLAGAGIGESAVSGGPSMKKMALAGIGAGESVVSGGPSMKKMGIAGTGAGESVASGGPSLKKMQIAGISEETSAATVAISMKKMEIQGTQQEQGIFSGAISMKKMGIAGTGSGESAVSGGPSMKKMSIAGISKETSSVSGAISMHKMQIFGIQEEEGIFSGDISMKKMQVAGISEETSVVSGGPSLKKMQIAGSVICEEASVASGAISMKKMQVAGISEETSVASGTVSMKKMQIRGSAVMTSKASDMFTFSLL